MFSSLALFVISILCFGISAISGGGAGLVLMPVLGMSIPAAEIPAALSIGTACSALSRITLFFKNIHWGIVARFVPVALPFAVLGVWLLSITSPVYLQLLLSLFLIGNVIFLFSKKTSTPRALSKNWLYAIGAASGLISGFTGATGLVFNHFYYRMGITKEQIVATRAANDILIHALKIFLYFFFGLLSSHSAVAGFTVALAAVLSSYLVKYILPFLNERLFKKIGYGMTVAAGIFMFMTATHNIMQQNKISLKIEYSWQKKKLNLFWKNHIIPIVDFT
ncbi:sulfite exporter TauE/SafE family protein [Entomobacter blattae]|uniref:Probable membrane transporter protein n=1 Tax=Entomobacter blattae TaxID=2762277 RepID=A0A7H1NU56_9PROT|nr:sulfite exporter TauE/SafE family protein [Entomobacter blattae]QNT79316.1 Sulfite exporter TauE/SafE [Entomobacter blattae]